MARKLFTNNANTTLAASISNVATSCAATSGGGSLFPAITGGSGNSFQMTLQHIVAGVVTAFEIVTVTARATDTFTIIRAQEGTAAAAWAAGDTLALLPTAADLAAFAQAVDLQAQAGNYATDTGVANAYIAAVTPALAAHSVGTPIVWKASNPNSGASTFSDGVGVGNLLTPNGQALLPNMVQTGGIYESVWDGTQFQLLNPTLNSVARGIVKTSNTSRTNNTFLADPQLQISLPSTNQNYEFEALVLIGGISGQPGGIAVGVGFTGTSSSGIFVLSGRQNSATIVAGQAPLGGQFGFTSAQGFLDWMLLKGSFQATSAGILELQWGQETTNATPTIVGPNSYLKVTPTN